MTSAIAYLVTRDSQRYLCVSLPWNEPPVYEEYPIDERGAARLASELVATWKPKDGSN